ncbi:MAG: ABC transporter permease subunit [Chloroflexi bacterium]|nr:ABC transporter permease subunit [Chloroflexota bacterium]
MLNNVFLKTMRDQRRSLIFWGIGLVALALYIALFFPTVSNMPELNKLLENVPKGLAALFGGQIPDYTSPVGYLNMELFSMMLPILLLVFTVGFGSGAIAGEEEKSTLDFLLANPIPRRRIVAEKFGAMVASLLLLAVVFYVGLVIGVVSVGMEVNYGRIAEATFSTLLLGLVFGSLALFLGCLRGNRGLSIGVTGALAVITYLLNSLGGMVEALKPYRILSPFYHHIDPNILANGLSPVHAGVLLGLIVIFFVLSLVVFERRDVAV